MKIVFIKGNRLDLKPDMQCERAFVHFLIKHTREDGTIHDDWMLVVYFNEKQLLHIKKDYPGMYQRMKFFGSYITPLIPGQPVWTWEIAGYPNQTESYYGFRIEE